MIHESIHYTPAKVIFGQELRLQRGLEFETTPEQPMLVNEFVMEMRNHLQRIYTIVRNQLCIASDWMKTCYNIRAKIPGQFVIILNSQISYKGRPVKTEIFHAVQSSNTDMARKQQESKQ